MKALSDRQIAGSFNVHEGRAHRVRLIGGADEPLYLPGSAAAPAIIRYTGDYPRSALHELAHWCLAGRERLAQVDYGYWYQPPPRSRAQQAQFMNAEVQVQALECLFAGACGLPFRVSVDDFDITPVEESAFSDAVIGRVRCFEASGLPVRAAAIRRRFAGLSARLNGREVHNDGCER